MIRPANDEVHVWSQLAADYDMQKSLTVLSADELLHLERIRKTEDRVRFASAHAGMRMILSSYLDEAPNDIRIGRSPCPGCGDLNHGPPTLQSPKVDLSFNLLHSGDRWMVAVAPGGPVSIDIEIVTQADEASAIVDVLNPEETRLLSACAVDARRRFLLRAWTRKEAVCKAIGVGLPGVAYLSNVWPDRAGPVDVEYPADPSGVQQWTIFDLSGGPVEYAALARPFGRTRHIIHCGDTLISLSS